MMRNKMSPMLQLALRYENLLNDDLKSLFMDEQHQGLWEIIMQYTENLEEIKKKFNLEGRDLQGGFAQLFVAKDQITLLTDLPQVVYLTIPNRYEYITVGLGQACASNLIGVNSTFEITGKGVLLAVIDSGIDYSHPDFRNEDGTTRITYLWDQTLPGDESALGWGQVFTQLQINDALKQPTKEEQLKIVPSVDTLGHGTALAGLAGGNGRGSVAQNNKGVAPDCSLIIVKMGKPGSTSPRDVEVMAGIDFCIEKAKEMGMPMTVLMGVGNNVTGHDGTAILEQYINARYNSWLCNYVVGTGNQGDRGTHASGKLEEGQSQTVEMLVEGNKVSYACCLWKHFSDDMSLVIEAPNGEVTEELGMLTPNRAYIFDQTAVLLNFSEPAISIEKQVALVVFQGQGGATINKGIWRFTIKANEILQGEYNVWSGIVKEEGDRTRFLVADLDTTLTSPATASKATAVSAYNGKTFQIAPFTGRGYTADDKVKPDLTAPGVNVTVPSSGSAQLYTTLSGTSLASAYVAGAYVLLMSYGILQLGNVNLYGESLKIYLLRGAKRPSAYAPYPNQSWGYGTLCISAAANLMRVVAEKTT